MPGLQTGTGESRRDDPAIKRRYSASPVNPNPALTTFSGSS